MHLGSLMGVVEHVTARHPVAEVREGDAEPPVRAQGFLKPGQSVTIIPPGAGGYGDPRERDRSLVRRDLAEGTISEEVARDVYGLEQERR